jgi:hypothetical protein
MLEEKIGKLKKEETKQQTDSKKYEDGSVKLRERIVQIEEEIRES